MREGDVFAGRYRVVRRAGSGGMGTVYEAHDIDRDVPVAVKTLRVDPDPRANRAADASRLVREAQALAEIRHPAVVRYVDHGFTPDHQPFLVMAWIEGETLAARLRGAGLTPLEALGLVSRLAAGLAAAHAHGIIHRDLKPSNVMLTGGDVSAPVIVDFGVARFARGGGDLTATGDHVGTLRYMAPEQIRRARTVDARADVFSLGCILYECLVGRACFQGDDPVHVLARILFEPIAAPSAERSDLPAAFDALTSGMLARDVRRRPVAAGIEALVGLAVAGLSADALRLRAPLPVDDLEGAAASTRGTRADDPDDEEPQPPSFQLGVTALATAAHRALPPQAGRFVGREVECDTLVGWLRARTAIVAVWGGPGLGKSRLVVETIRRIASEPTPPWDALVYADLREARDADDIVRVVAGAAQVSLDSSDAPEDALGRALGKLGRVLLVVDPVEHVSSLVAALAVRFVRASPRVQVLAASRRKWSPPGSMTLELGPLGTEGVPGRPSAAAMLLLDRVGGDVSGPESGAVDERAERLAGALEGIPLAIELAATSVPVLGFDGVLARLRPHAASGLASLSVVRAPMRRALDGSWQGLTEEEQDTLAQCAVFRGGFTVEAAESVVRPANPSTSVLALVQALREHGLLRSWTLESSGRVRLSMFGPVHEFAWEKLRERAGASGALTRHAAHYAELCDAGGRAPTGPVVALVEREADNLLAAAEFSLGDDDGDPIAGMRALLALESAVFLRGVLSSYRALLDRALERAERGTPAPATVPDAASVVVMRVRQTRARLDAPAGGAKQARLDLDLCLADARRRGDAHREGLVWLDLGVVEHLEHEWSAARRSYEAAMASIGAVDEPGARGRCLANLGALCHDERDVEAAARLYRQAIVLFEQAGDSRRLANVLVNLAVLEQELGRPAAALGLYEQAIGLLESLRDARMLAIALGNLGVLRLELAEPAAAVALHGRSLALLAGMGDARSHALCAARLAAALSLVDRAAEGELRMADAERIAANTEPLTVAAVSLMQAFLDLAAARHALSAGAREKGAACIDAARRRMARVVEGDAAERLRDRSDDIRSTLRILAPLLRSLEGRPEFSAPNE